MHLLHQELQRINVDIMDFTNLMHNARVEVLQQLHNTFRVEITATFDNPPTRESKLVSWTMSRSLLARLHVQLSAFIADLEEEEEEEEE